MIQPNLRSVPADWRQVCRHASDAAMEIICGKPATWHIVWYQDANGVFQGSTQCDPHMEWVQKNYVYLERHRIGAWCVYPNSRWMGDHCSMPSDASISETVREEITV